MCVDGTYIPVSLDNGRFSVREATVICKDLGLGNGKMIHIKEVKHDISLYAARQLLPVHVECMNDLTSSFSLRVGHVRSRFACCGKNKCNYIIRSGMCVRV